MITSSNQLGVLQAAEQSRLVMALLAGASVAAEDPDAAALGDPAVIQETVERADQVLNSNDATLHDLLAVLQDNANLQAFQGSFAMARAPRLQRLRASMENDLAASKEWGPFLRQLQNIGIRADNEFVTGLGGAAV